MIDAVVTNGRRPQGWSRKSNATYYKSVYAEQFIKVLDAMFDDRQDRMYRYDQWKHMTPASVYLRVNQSIRYLLDNMDPDQKYAKLLDMICITRERNVGVKLTFREEFRNGSSEFSPSSVVPAAEMPRWKQRIEDWLNECEPGGKPFILENLLLSPEEVRDLKLEFVGITNVMSSITSNSIKLIKVNDA